MRLPSIGSLLRTLAVLAAGVVLYQHFTTPKSGLGRGTPAPDFSAPRLGADEPFHLADTRGRVVLLDFWATWCPPCRKSLPALQRLHERYADSPDVLVLTVNAEDGGESLVPAFMQRNRYDFPVLFDRGAISRAYNVKSLPTTVVVGPDGKVAEVFVGVSARDADALAEHLGAAIEALRAPEG